MIWFVFRSLDAVAKRFRGSLAADDLPRKQQKVHVVKVIVKG